MSNKRKRSKIVKNANNDTICDSSNDKDNSFQNALEITPYYDGLRLLRPIGTIDVGRKLAYDGKGWYDDMTPFAIWHGLFLIKVHDSYIPHKHFRVVDHLDELNRWVLVSYLPFKNDIVIYEGASPAIYSFAEQHIEINWFSIENPKTREALVHAGARLHDFCEKVYICVQVYPTLKIIDFPFKDD